MGLEDGVGFACWVEFAPVAGLEAFFGSAEPTCLCTLVVYSTYIVSRPAEKASAFGD